MTSTPCGASRPSADSASAASARLRSSRRRPLVRDVFKIVCWVALLSSFKWIGPAIDFLTREVSR